MTVESGEGIESVNSVNNLPTSRIMWNPVKELKGIGWHID